VSFLPSLGVFAPVSLTLTWPRNWLSASKAPDSDAATDNDKFPYPNHNVNFRVFKTENCASNCLSRSGRELPVFPERVVRSAVTGGGLRKLFVTFEKRNGEMRERERALLHSHNVTWGLDLGLKIPPNPTVLQTRFFFHSEFLKRNYNSLLYIFLFPI
jgi:hypothetical protein